MSIFKSSLRSIKLNRGVKYLVKRSYNSDLVSRSELIKAEPVADYQGLYIYTYQGPNDCLITSKDGKLTLLSFVMPEHLKSKQKGIFLSQQVIGTFYKQLEPETTKNLPASQFEENPGFFEIVHQVLKNGLETLDPQLGYAAQHQKEGWMHINDERNLPPFGRIAEPEDIFGSVLLSKGEIQGETYQPMPTHRPLTPQNGLFRLPEPFQNKLVATLKELK